ncbi:MAG: hypothetical protein BJ554DRAFT_2217 [Olpidium bornovanus]|uniref:Protein kinase domain-containing protein n=1 Tax=Olpidium bornovanus TaxID=278681 RepID=A0A8H8DGL0_9FUNG|nr:MAG: hypothetical protein BJ554DRAFT_2217 [Olpidium bornovanus]
MDADEDEIADIQQEISFLSQLSSVAGVTTYYGSFLQGMRLWIIMDYAAGGSIRDLVGAANLP